MAQKQVYLGQLGQKQVHTKIKSKAHPTSHAIGPKRIVPVFRRTKPRYTWVCLLCLTFNCFLSFCSQSEALRISALCPPCECRRTGRPLPPSTPHTTPYGQRTYLPTHLRRGTYIPHTDTYLHHGHRRQCVCCIRNRGRLDLSYDA